MIKEQLKERLAVLKAELKEREDALQDKIDLEIEYYGKPLGKYASFMRKIGATERKIVKHEERIRKAWMTKRDANILNNILHEKDDRKHTSVKKPRYSVDNRYNGSYNSRNIAKTMERKK
tara:strand:+ start:188 stop:547 length:360 start_codon:yes stop_codon:yes gene_type:complete